MIKIVFVFLAVVAGISMLGSTVVKFLRGAPQPPAAPKVSSAKCAHCGRTVLGTAPCVCGKG